jgi:protein-L-isoaspartate(D-aspartate) O-methyltransferase
VILVSAGSPRVPEALVDQLADPGRMLLPVGTRKQQELVLVRKRDGQVTEDPLDTPCTFVPLLGRFGWAPTEGTAS